MKSKKNLPKKVNFNLNGLNGQMLSVRHNGNMPNLLIIPDWVPKDKYFKLLYRNLHQSYNIISFPIPGMGYMSSLRIKRQKESIENMADVLYSFIKLEYQNRPITIVNIGIGQILCDVLLIRYPELKNRIERVVAFKPAYQLQEYVYNQNQIKILYFLVKIGYYTTQPLTLVIYLFIQRFFRRPILVVRSPKLPSSKSHLALWGEYLQLNHRKSKIDYDLYVIKTDKKSAKRCQIIRNYYQNVYLVDNPSEIL